MQAFKLNSIDYLLKPVEETELSEAFKKFVKNKIPADAALLMEQIEKMNRLFQQNQAGYKTRFLLRIGEKMEVIAVKDIAFFFADKKIVFLFTTDNKKYIVDESLDELQQQLSPQDFYRANRQYLIQISSIQKLHAHLNGRLKVILKKFEETEVLVPREKNTDFKKWLAK